MKEVWTKNWKDVLIWLSGYFSLITYAIVGGYVIVKSDDEELKKTAKTTFIVTLIFTALSALLALYNYCGSFADAYYSSVAYKVYTISNTVLGIAKIIVYAIFIILALVNKKDPVQQPAQNTEEESAE